MKRFWFRLILMPSGLIALALLGAAIYFAITATVVERGPYTDPGNAAWTLLSLMSSIASAFAFVISAMFAITRMPMATVWIVQVGVILGGGLGLFLLRFIV